MRRARWKDYRLRAGSFGDLARICSPGGLAHCFWSESDYKLFTKLDIDQFYKTTYASLEQGTNIFVVAELDGTLVGFVLITLLRWFTTDPVGSTYLLYVEPRHRMTPVGRMLVAAACDIAKGEGAKAVIVGAMAGIKSTDRTLMNMLAHLGFHPFGGLARKIFW